MRRVRPALFVFSVLVGIAGPVNALDPKTLWEQQECQSY